MRPKLRLLRQKTRRALLQTAAANESASKCIESNIATMTARAHAAIDIHAADTASVLNHLNIMAAAAKARLRRYLRALDKHADDLDTMICVNARTALAVRAAALQQHVLPATRVAGLFKLRSMGFAQAVLVAQPVPDACVQFARVVTQAFDAARSRIQLPQFGLVKYPLDNVIRVRLRNAFGTAVHSDDFCLLLASKQTVIYVTYADDVEENNAFARDAAAHQPDSNVCAGDIEYNIAFTIDAEEHQPGIDVCAELFLDGHLCASWTLTPLYPGPFAKKRHVEDAPLQLTLLPLRESSEPGATTLASVSIAAFPEALQRLQTFAAWYGFASTFDQRPTAAAKLQFATIRPDGKYHCSTLYVSSRHGKVVFETLVTADVLHKPICAVLVAPDMRAAWDAAPNALLLFRMKAYWDVELHSYEYHFRVSTTLAEFLRKTCRPVAQKFLLTHDDIRKALICILKSSLMHTHVLFVASACMALKRLGEPVMYASLQHKRYDTEDLWLEPLVKMHCE